MVFTRITLLNKKPQSRCMKLPRIQPKIMGVPVSIETARNLAKAGRDIAMKRYVPDDVKRSRMEHCMICPSWEHRSNRCLECGCQMRVKTSLTSSECPLGKWGRLVILNTGNSAIDAAEHKESAEQTSN
tara:strand:- start:151 stop:537 length:387 start_codon:yes stop_codon:yes gene_type:complete